ncbi:hypothetical protein AYI69_g6178 [Smittium culicis]|uniref:Adhesin domain-containing protein n=1 Tax=Smittium culicis TaxID=133412 RepID=A0A1R1Y0Q2_9FUNG|nr:hypothetical protein AYI69_g6178 [Smittium culicis]
MEGYVVDKQFGCYEETCMNTRQTKQEKQKFSLCEFAKYAFFAVWGLFSMYAIKEIFFNQNSQNVDILYAVGEYRDYSATEFPDYVITHNEDQPRHRKNSNYLNKRGKTEYEITNYSIDSSNIARIFVHTLLDTPISIEFGFTDDQKTNEIGFETSIVQSRDEDYRVQAEYTPNDRQGITVSITPVSDQISKDSKVEGFNDAGSSASLKIALPKSIKKLSNVIIDITHGDFRGLNLTRNMLTINNFTMMSKDASFSLDGLNADHVSISSDTRPIVDTFTVNESLELRTVTGDIVVVTEYASLDKDRPENDASVNVSIKSRSGNILLITDGAEYSGKFSAVSLNGSTLVESPSKRGEFEDLIVANFGRYGNYTSFEENSRKNTSSMLSLHNNSGSSKIVFI